MRGDVVYRVYGQHQGRADDVFRTEPEARAKIEELQSKKTEVDEDGYVKLATAGWNPPWKDSTTPLTIRSPPPPFIRVRREGGRSRVRFAVELDFDVASGEVDEIDRRCLNREPGAEWG